MIEATADLTIGIPVFNGADFVADALDSLLRQSHAGWKLIISDNASSDNTVEIISRYAALDSRIHLIRNSVNQGATYNFNKVAEKIETPYFMWMAADDVLEPDFLSSCLGRLRKDPGLGMAFATIRNIDAYGREIRSYPHLHRLTGQANLSTIFRFLTLPEAMGKANLFYSVYRSDVCKRAMHQFPFGMDWGGDMAFVLGAIAIAGIDVTPEVLFNKRLVRPADSKDRIDPVVVEEGIYFQSCPVDSYPEYMGATLRSLKARRFKLLAWMVLNYRYRQVRKIHEARLKLAQPKPPEPVWLARTNRALRRLKLKR